MFIFKLIILVLLFGVCLKIGITISKKYVNRVIELKNMKDALSMFETKIRFTYEPIPEIFNEISKQIGGKIGKIFENAVRRNGKK